MACGLAFLLAGCSEKNEYVAPPPPKVTVAAPLKQEVTRYLDFTGNTDAINTVDLVARVEGFLTSIDYKDGSVVKKGDRLFLIQQNTYQANLDGAKAAQASAAAAYLNAKTEYGRQATLGQQDFSSQAVVDKAKANMDQAEAGVESAKANVEIAEINLGYTEVTAPFDGIVTRHLADVGQLVGHAAPTTLATIVQMDPIYVYFNINETQVLRIKEALARRGKTLINIQEIEVDIGLQTEDGYPHKGRLDYVAPQVDASTGTLQVRALFENKDLALLPGLFVRVRVPVQKIPDALLVDDTAIGTSQQGSYVLTVGADNTVTQQVVKTGQLVGQYRVIESGLSITDKVVVGGIQRAIPGAKVEPEQAPATPAATASPAATPATGASPAAPAGAATPAKP
ncbi:efflux RND transporter periplasmic adaptor subunit [Bosea sp. 117]|uniref:efflux RND transporter periplasmic adaptor subunit n=1 Tax=Bosea sp. 117 TaxID=1125973 RepID=UPI0004947F17|nr:efflux RND transporter periplasmic adaptor subunit [Bosea sp. 117]